jgi:hypothetical protein
MSGPILSPDGKWMWTGEEWIPAPPPSELTIPVREQVERILVDAKDVEVNLKQLIDDCKSKKMENEMAYLHLSLAEVYMAQNRFHNAELELITARNYLDKFPDNDVEVGLLLSSDFWLPLGKNGMQMDDNIEKILLNLKSNPKVINNSKGLTNILQFEISMELTNNSSNVAEIEILLQEYYDHVVEYGDEKGIPFYHESLCGVAMEQKNHQRAADHLKRSFEIRSKLGMETLGVRTNLHWNRRITGDIEGYSNVAMELLDEWKGSGHFVWQKAILTDLVSFYEDLNDIEGALLAQERLIDLFQSTGSVELLDNARKRHQIMVANRDAQKNSMAQVQSPTNALRQNISQQPHINSGFSPPPAQKYYRCMKPGCGYAEHGPFVGLKKCIRCGSSMNHR